jgi:4'-phosphopantetheinyl transferase
LDKRQLDRYRAKVTAGRTTLSLSASISWPVVYNVDEHDFEMGQATASLANGDFVILYAKCTSANGGDPAAQGVYLSAAETQRYNSYKSAKAAQQFLQGRKMIREMLASYLAVTTMNVEVTCLEHIKPVASCQTSSLKPPKFNLSHSGDWVVLAIDRHSALGIDIECETQCDIDAIASLSDLFTQNERAYLERQRAPDHMERLFLQLWRGKEAIMKATGKGFALAPNSFELLTPEGQFKKIIKAERSTWSLMQITLRTGLDCAIAQLRA